MDNEGSWITASFTTEELRDVQRKDSDIGPLLEWMELSPQQLKFCGHIGIVCARTMGVLYRNWEDSAGKSSIKQLVLPKVLTYVWSFWCQQNTEPPERTLLLAEV